jgi:sulfate transport system substrate-binding protein
VVVDKNAKAHCVTKLANAFVSYLHTPDAQEIFQTVGYERPVSVAAAQKGSKGYPAIKDLFTADNLGGWPKLSTDTVFGPNGVFTKAFKAAKG